MQKITVTLKSIIVFPLFLSPAPANPAWRFQCVAQALAGRRDCRAGIFCSPCRRLVGYGPETVMPHYDPPHGGGHERQSDKNSMRYWNARPCPFDSIGIDAAGDGFNRPVCTILMHYALRLAE
jgi:hypothetical protein